MTNPWLKKNPFLSLWLSAANSAAGVARHQAAAAMQRQSSALMTKATQDFFSLWMPPLAAPSKPRTKRKSRR